MTTNVSLNFMPAFYHRHLGVRFGEPYYADPAYRATVDVQLQRLLYEHFGRFGVGSPDPQPATSLFIQPVDLMMRTQGAEWRFPEDASLESWGQPWKSLSLREIEAIDPRETAAHPAVVGIIRQYHELKRLYADQADALGVRSETMNIHGPYTTAHQLMGESLFTLMLDDPAGAQRIFKKIWQLYQAILGRIADAAEAGAPQRINIGDCAASMLSPALYQRCVLPINIAIASQFNACIYHSCGPSSHLLEAFASLPALEAIQLGPGTELEKAHKTLPAQTRLQPLVDPLLLRDRPVGEVEERTLSMLQTLDKRGGGTLLTWSLDVETSVDNVCAVYETVQEYETHKAG